MKRLFVMIFCWLVIAILQQNALFAVRETQFTGRAISLNMLQEHAEKCSDTAQCPGYDTFFGLTKIIGFIIDPAARDLIIVGQIDPSLPTLYTEDFAVALRNVWMKYAERRGNTTIYTNLGCSIDPDPRIVGKLQELGVESMSNSSHSQVEDFIQEWHSVCRSPQEVRVLGMPFNTRFAKVLVQADYDMKRLADGSDALDVDGFTSLSEKTLDKYKAHVLGGGAGEFPMSFLNRFEFVPSECPFHREKGGFFLDDCPVKLVTEEEYLQKSGTISGTGQANPLAQQFCDEFTTAYAEVARKRPIYAELEGLFRFAALAKLIHHKQDELEKSGVDLSYFLETYPVAEETVDSTLDGISNVQEFQHREELENGFQEWSIWLPSCGGVSIVYQLGKNLIARQKPARWAILLLRAALGQRPSMRTLFWSFVVNAVLP